MFGSFPSVSSCKMAWNWSAYSEGRGFPERQTKLLRHPGRNVSMHLPFFAQVVELVDTQVSEACA
jgi:hypothetical protein